MRKIDDFYGYTIYVDSFGRLYRSLKTSGPESMPVQLSFEEVLSYRQWTVAQQSLLILEDLRKQ